MLPLLFSLVLWSLCRPSLSLFSLPSCANLETSCVSDEEAAKAYVNSLSEVFRKASSKRGLAEFQYSTNITDETAKLKNTESLNFDKLANGVSSNLKNYNWKTFNDEELKRRAKLYYVQGSAAPEKVLIEIAELQTKQNGLYATGKICKFKERNQPNCEKSMSIEPDITEAMASSRDPKELLYFWEESRNAVSNKTSRDTFIKRVNLYNISSVSKGFKNLQEEWLEAYETEDFPSLVDSTWRQSFTYKGEEVSLEGLYKQLHAYVRMKLMAKYNKQGADIKAGGLIPAHLLGNMWAQSWINIIDLVTPFPEAESFDVTGQLSNGSFQVIDFFKMAEKFFVTLGFEPMTDKFWKYSMIEKPKDGRDVVCHGSADDIMEKDDYRIKMCTTLTQGDFKTVHHEMGHIEYYMQYRDQPYPYRMAPNPGFHEAIGDTIALSVKSPTHLHRIGLMKPGSEEGKEERVVSLADGSIYKEADINYLMLTALEKVAFLPYAMVLDRWRWNMFTHKTKETNLNADYWRLREELQGIGAPVPRNESNLDPLAKYHVPADVPYIRYYVSFISQFQFYEALCKRAKEYDPDDASSKILHLCDYSVGGKETGELLRNMMKKGQSVHWTEAMNEVTGQSDMSGFPLIKYFFPLYKFLKEENQKAGNHVGWKP